MKKEEFKSLVSSRYIIMDGATGSNLIKRGMPSGVCTELWIADNPEVITGLQKEYRQAGSDIILAPTFGANRPLLTKHGLGDKVGELNKKLVTISKRANPDAIIAGDVSMTGLMVEPLGDTEFDELVDVYREQITALCEAGVDVLDIETMMYLEDAKAAVMAAKEVCDIPIMVTMSYTESGKTMYGNSPDEVICAMQELGVDACGINCSAGPDNVLPIVEKMDAFAKVPLIVKPNAGLPERDKDGNTIYSMGPKEFVACFDEILKYNVRIIGGCCGTTPEHIKELHKRFADLT